MQFSSQPTCSVSHSSPAESSSVSNKDSKKTFATRTRHMNCSWKYTGWFCESFTTQNYPLSLCITLFDPMNLNLFSEQLRIKFPDRIEIVVNSFFQRFSLLKNPVYSSAHYDLYLSILKLEKFNTVSVMCCTCEL